ncbi:MAG: hypothetical protein ABIJ34_07770 [archaeon]
MVNEANLKNDNNGVMKINLLYLIRDIEPGKNTLITLSDVLRLGKNALIFCTEPKSAHYGKLDAFNHEFLEINKDFAHVFDPQTIFDNSVLENAVDLARRNFETARKAHRVMDSEYDKAREAYDNATTARQYFSPAKLFTRFKAVDVVAAPRETVEYLSYWFGEGYDIARQYVLTDFLTNITKLLGALKEFGGNQKLEEQIERILSKAGDNELVRAVISAEITDAILGIDIEQHRMIYERWLLQSKPAPTFMVLEESNNVVWRAEQDKINLPRLIVDRSYLNRPSSELEIDGETLEDLFRREQKLSRGPYFFRSSSDKILPDSFYGFLRPLTDYINPISRSRISMKQGEITFGRSSTHTLPSRMIQIPANMFGFGPGHRGKGYYSSAGYLKAFREEKQQDIVNTFEAIWTHPLRTVDEINHRLDLYSELISGGTMLQNIDSLEHEINFMIEPFMHLSGLSKLMHMRLVKSHLGTRIFETEFYNDFIEVSKMFVESYEHIYSLIQNIKPSTRELQALLAPVMGITEASHPLTQSYNFIKVLLEQKPRSFEDISDYFREQLKELKAKTAYTLEEFEAPKIGISVVERDYRSEKLEQFNFLRNKYYSLFPVSMADKFVEEYLNNVGTRLAAFSAKAKYMIEAGWKRPEILPAELGIVEINQGYYPFTLLQDSDRIVPNNTNLDGVNRIEIIEGTNVGGKSIYIKMALFIAYMAQTGSFVPADDARISKVDKIYYRRKGTGIGEQSALLEDLDIATGAINTLTNYNKFRPEQEVRQKHVLIGLDETFTSTNDSEGESFTTGLLHKFSNYPNARVMIASHYPSLHDLLNDSDVNGVSFSHFRFTRTSQGLKFPHIKFPGINTVPDYALAVAEAQGLSPKIIAYAQELLRKK